VVALRAGRRWLPTTQPLRLDDEDDPASGLRPNGVWLVTGGLGGIGRAVAEHLAQRAQARVVLIGRSASEERTAAAERLVRAAGGDVLVRAVDVTDRDALRTLRAEIEERFGPLNGIVHAAGVPGGGTIELTDPATVNSVLAPKVAGTLALAEVFRDLPLDAFVLCSSVSAVLGGIGLVDYAAANAFLDAYARSAGRPVPRTVSIGWGGWLETGMYAEWLDERRQAGRAPALPSTAEPGIRPAEGADALRRVLAAGLAPHVLISAYPLEEIPTTARPASTKPVSREPAAEEAEPAAPVERDRTGPFVPPRTDLERALAALWVEALGVDEIGVEDDYFDLGGNSMTAVYLIWRVNEDLGASITIRTLSETSTIAGMAAAIERARAEAAEGAPRVEVPPGTVLS
jgi:NAD(P)-dependent dehydrogenase (short-subunit alcohol dehydrogenase family)